MEPKGLVEEKASLRGAGEASAARQKELEELRQRMGRVEIQLPKLLQVWSKIAEDLEGLKAKRQAEDR